MKKLFPLLFLFIAALAGCRQTPPANSAPANSSNTAKAVKDPQAKLALVASRLDRSKEGFVSIIGQVQNISPDNLDNIEALLSSYDENKKVLATEKSPIEARTLAPNQTSSFQVTMKFNPNSRRHLVTFAAPDGKEIKYTQNDPPNQNN